MPEPEGCAECRFNDVFESPRFCAGRRYRSGDAFAGVSKEVRDKSGTVELILISEPDREPTTESSFDEGPDAVSEEEVEAEAPCIDCLTSPFTAPFGADVVRDSERTCGDD